MFDTSVKHANATYANATYAATTERQDVIGGFVMIFLAVLAMILLILCVAVQIELQLTDDTEDTDTQGTNTQDEHGIAIQRMDTPVATPVASPRETSVDSVPVAAATGIRTVETVDAMVTLPPAMIAEMEAVPNAVTTLV